MDLPTNSNSALASFIKKGIKNGTTIDKGVVLTEKYLFQNYSKIGELLNTFIAYPDLYLDYIKPEGSGFTLFFYQRIVLRAVMRYSNVFVTAPRAFSKSFLTILGLMLQCAFIPGTRRFICAPQINQSVKIAKEKIIEIYNRWPLLRREIVGCELSDTPGSFQKDMVIITFKNGSIFSVVGANEGTRGQRQHGGLIDEVRDHIEDLLNSVIFPLLNVARRLPDNSVNVNEPNNQRIFMTSAGNKSSFAYDLMTDIFVDSVIHPKDNFCFGCDYRVPLKHGLLTKSYVENLKTSSSFSESAFAREYCSIWEGASDDSWFNYDKLNKYRKLKNPETRAKKYNLEGEQFYLLSVDVARYSDQTVVCVYHVTVSGEGVCRANLVNIYVLTTLADKTFYNQVIELKKIIQAFNPREVVIDTNGIGYTFGEMMTQEQIKDGITYPAYGFFNNEEYEKYQPKDCLKILYSLKANSTLNTKIHGNAYGRVSNGLVHFLIKEQDAKTQLLSTVASKSMKPEERIKRLMPHEMTTRLFEEICNLRLKPTGSVTEIALEQINSRCPKDKYSAFAYGLWRIKEIEDEYILKRKRKLGANGRRKLIFFSGGN